jgi:type IV pilus assembly protein PilX
MTISKVFHGSRSRKKSQAGIVLIVALICLVILSLGAIGLYRSTDVATLQAGSVSLMVDQNNKSEICVRRAVSWMADPASGLDVRSGADQPQFNYYGRQFTPAQSNAKYTVNANLLSTRNNGWMGTAPDIDAGDGVRLNCTIERLCQRVDKADKTHCEMATLPEGGQGLAGSQQPDVGNFPAYRITTRVDGTRGSAFLQVTVSPNAN